MSIESIRARLRRHDRQRMRYGYSDETAPQIWERDLRALLKVAEAAKAQDPPASANLARALAAYRESERPGGEV